MSEVKTALVTGAGRGIGKAIALKLAERGYNVAVNYGSSAAKAQETADQIKELGVQSIAVKANVADRAEVAAMFKEVAEKLGPVDVLVCNAGITKDNLLMRMKDEEWSSVIDTNLTSVFNCAKEALRPMIKAKHGRIIAISSVTGIVGNPGQCNYAATKAGIIGFVKSLAKEIASRNITVNAVAPGYIVTDMTESMSDAARDAMLKAVPAGRAGTPQDVANAVAFLASEDASYVTGQVITVDGGMTMC